MKTIINPAAKEINFTAFVSIQNLETEGFDFDQYHYNTSNTKGISFEQAQDYNYQTYIAKIEAVEGKTFVSWYSQDRNETTEREATGDDEKTLQDICNLIDAGLLSIDESKDFSVDSNDKYVPAFLQMAL